MLQLAMLPTTAIADEMSPRQIAAEARWIPSGSLFSMGAPQKGEARASSDASPNLDGDSVLFPWLVGGSLELASPVVADVPGRPRIFVHSDIAYAFATEDPVVTEGDPGAPPEVVGNPPSVEAIENVGSEVRVEPEPLVLSAGLGAVFQFERWDRTFRIRPSLEWMYSRDRMKSVLGGGEIETPANPRSPNICGPCRTVFIEAQTEKGFHSLGPGLEVETDAGRLGDFLVSVYASGRAYRILGDRKAELTASGAWETSNGEPTTRPDTVFRTSYRREPWHYRFGFGLRVSWLPE
jgi:hypothetical protein